MGRFSLDFILFHDLTPSVPQRFQIGFAFGSSAVDAARSACAATRGDPWLSALPLRRVRLFQASKSKQCSFVKSAPLATRKSNVNARVKNSHRRCGVGQIGFRKRSYASGDTPASHKRHRLGVCGCHRLSGRTKFIRKASGYVQAAAPKCSQSKNSLNSGRMMRRSGCLNRDWCCP